MNRVYFYTVFHAEYKNNSFVAVDTIFQRSLPNRDTIKVFWKYSFCQKKKFIFTGGAV